MNNEREKQRKERGETPSVSTRKQTSRKMLASIIRPPIPALKETPIEPTKKPKETETRVSIYLSTKREKVQEKQFILQKKTPVVRKTCRLWKKKKKRKGTSQDCVSLSLSPTPNPSPKACISHP
jgi:hypothetical protein